MTKSPDFNAPDLVTAVRALSAAERDRLPFGSIHLDADGVVLWFSQSERTQSGFNREALGKTFFTDVAPCMNNGYFAGRIDKARRAGTLDIAFSFVGDFNDRNRELNVRVQSAPDGGAWIFIQRPGMT